MADFGRGVASGLAILVLSANDVGLPSMLVECLHANGHANDNAAEGSPGDPPDNSAPTIGQLLASTRQMVSTIKGLIQTTIDGRDR